MSLNNEDKKEFMKSQLTRKKFGDAKANIPIKKKERQQTSFDQICIKKRKPDPISLDETKKQKTTISSPIKQTESSPNDESGITIRLDMDNRTENFVGIKIKLDRTKTAGGGETLAEKYRPKKISEIVGNGKKVEEIVEWLKDHQKKTPGTCLGLMIIGPPGCGKTTIASLIPKELGYDVHEMNMLTRIDGKRGSKKLSKGNPNNEASIVIDGILPMMSKTPLPGKPHAVVVDEIENIGTKKIIRPLWQVPGRIGDKLKKPLHGILHPVRVNAKNSKRKVLKVGNESFIHDDVEYNWPAPLIMTVNDAQKNSIKELKNATTSGSGTGSNKLVKIIYFNRLENYMIRKRLEFICKRESILPCDLQMISECSCGDMRRALMLLEWSIVIHENVVIGKDSFGNDIKMRKMIPDQVKSACMLCGHSELFEKYTDEKFTHSKNSDPDNNSENHTSFGRETPILDEEDRNLFILDMNAQDVCNKALKECNDRNYLEQLFEKMNEDFIECMVNTHTPAMLDTAFGKSRHPYLEKASKDCDCKSNLKNFIFTPCMKHSDHKMDAMTEICDSRSIGDIYNKQNAWKKTEAYPYYMFHSRVYPSLLSKLPDRQNRANLKIDWIETKIQYSQMMGGPANKKISLLKQIFDANALEVMQIVKIMKIINERWYDAEYLKSVIPDINVGKYSGLEISDHVIFNLEHEPVQNFIKQEEPMIGVLRFQKGKENCILGMITAIKEEENNERDDKVLNISDEVILSEQHLRYAKFLASCRITPSDLDNLLFFAKLKDAGTMTLDIKDFGGKMTLISSLHAKLDQIWKQLLLQGVDPKPKIGKFDRLVFVGTKHENLLKNGKEKKAYIEK